MIIKVIGALMLLAGLVAVVVMYHIMTQTIWHDIIQEEFEERYDQEIEDRWRSQQIRIHAQMVIKDEMGAKE